MSYDELQSIDWLAVCTNRDRATIRRLADVVDIPAGTVLLREGDAPRWFYALIDGNASASVDGEVVQELGAGELVNHVEVLHNVPAPATVVASTDLRALVMGRREFLGMLDEIPGLARRVLVPHIPRMSGPTRPRRPVLVPLPAA